MTATITGHEVRWKTTMETNPLEDKAYIWLGGEWVETKPGDFMAAYMKQFEDALAPRTGKEPT